MICRRLSAALMLLSLLAAAGAHAQKQLVLSRQDATVSLEPYAPNIVRITISFSKDAATAKPGYGITAAPAESGWHYEHTDTLDTFSSGRLTVRLPIPHYGPSKTKYTCDTCQYFSGSTPGVPLTVTGDNGKPLLDMAGWQMSVPNYKDGNAQILNDVKPSV